MVYGIGGLLYPTAGYRDFRMRVLPAVLIRVSEVEVAGFVS